MRQEAASAGPYRSALGEHPRIQLLTIEDVLESGKTVDYPPRLHIVPRAASARKGYFLSAPITPVASDHRRCAAAQPR